MRGAFPCRLKPTAPCAIFGGSYVTYRQVTDGSADTIVDVVAHDERRARSPEALDAERA